MTYLLFTIGYRLFTGRLSLIKSLCYLVYGNGRIWRVKRCPPEVKDKQCGKTNSTHDSRKYLDSGWLCSFLSRTIKGMVFFMIKWKTKHSALTSVVNILHVMYIRILIRLSLSDTKNFKTLILMLSGFTTLCGNWRI